MKNNNKIITKCMICKEPLEVDSSELNSSYQNLILCNECKNAILFLKHNYKKLESILNKNYSKPSIDDEKIEIEDSIASSGNDIYNVREIFK